MILVDPDGLVLGVNREFTRLFGWSAGEARGRNINDLIVPADRRAEAEAATMKTGAGMPSSLVTRRRRRDGTEVDVSVRCAPIALPGGQRATCSVYSDVTARVAAEELLRSAEERFRQLAENVDEVFWLVSPADREILYVSPVYEAVWGRTVESLIADPWSFLEGVHPDDRERLRASLPRQQLGGYEEEYRVVRPDGDVRWVRSRAFPIRDAAGRVYRIAGLTEDITARREAAEALRVSEEKFAKALRASPDSLAVSTLADGRVLEVNQNYCTFYGYTRDETIGRTLHELKLYDDPSDRERLVAALRERGAVADFETRVRRRSGEVCTMVLSAELIEFDGQLCVLSVARDVTAARAASRELVRSRQRLRDLAARLEGVREEQRAVIAREIHDELGQSLTGLRLELSFVAQALPRHLRQLHEHVRAMVTQVDGTIDTVRRISSELRPGVLDELGLVAAVEWQADLFQRTASIPCVLTVAGEDVFVDRDRAIVVFRTLQEALTNVVRHADARAVGIHLTISTLAVDLEIRDDGRGITSWEAASALGLGLLGMRERALQWDGEVTVRGDQGRGTTVRLHLPQVRTGEMAIAFP